MARFLGLRGKSLATAISVTCGFCFLCFGYAQGVMGGLLTVQQFLVRFPQLDIANDVSFHDAWVTGLTVGTWHLGCIVSAITTIFVGDLLGRRRTLILGLTFWVIGEIIQTSSYSFPQFIVGRAVAGFGNGFTTATAPAYQAECVKSHRKGTILMISAGAFVSAGIALSYWLVFGFAYINSSSASWRIPIALQIVFALPAIAMLFVLPESPRWLILTGREQEALTVLAALNDDDPDSFETKDEFLQIKDAILLMAQGSSVGMFSNKERRGFHRVVLAYFVQIFQQGTGINLVLQYLSWIFLTRMSYTGWLARLLASCSATLYFLASFVVVVGIDRFWGRRSLMMFGATGMSTCMILITILQYLWSEKGMQEARIASTVFLFIFSVFFAIGWQGMAWLYQVEIVPLRIRGPANGLSTSANWLLNFVIVFITPIAFQRISYRTWIIFAVTNFAIIPLVYFFYPETAFRSLEEVDVIFQIADDAPGNAWLNAVKISKDEPLWFGKQDPEKRLNFNYANTSWHKRLIETASSGKSSNRGGTAYQYDEKKHMHNNHNPYPETILIPNPPRGRQISSEFSIDPYMHNSPSPSTLTKTHTNDAPSRKKLQKRHSATSTTSISSHARPSSSILFPSHTSPFYPEQQQEEDAAPAPSIPRSRSTSRASNTALSHHHHHHHHHPHSPTQQPNYMSRSARTSDISISNNMLNRIINPDLLAQQQQQQSESESESEAELQCYAEDRSEMDEDAAVVGHEETWSYPGLLLGEERLVRTQSERHTDLPDGVYEVVQGRVRRVSGGTGRPESRGRWVARDAGRAW
ncbi:hypothetical protein BM1_09297 [Bipolaris maydis]|nr:hypothetical protein BM1_09297 [Bipolaris maydis]